MWANGAHFVHVHAAGWQEGSESGLDPHLNNHWGAALCGALLQCTCLENVTINSCWYVNKRPRAGEEDAALLSMR